MGVLIIVLIAVVALGVSATSGNTRKRKRDGTKTRKKNAVGQIYKTTDGVLSGNGRVKKKRRVAVVEKRKDDGALAVVKIYKKTGKEEKQKEGKTYIPNLTLTPKKHKSLTEDSIVGRKVFFGKKGEDGKYKAFYPMDLIDTEDKLTRKELKRIKKEVHNDTPQHRALYERKKEDWENHFKKA